jgi:alpha-L-rhamnosidase
MLKKMHLVWILLFLILSSCTNQNKIHSPASQPYGYILAKKTGDKTPFSPDPLIGWQWENPQASDDLEIYILKPVDIKFDTPESFKINRSSKNTTKILVTGNGDIRFDFGQVNAAWLEFDSKDLRGTIEMSISEYNEPAILNSGAQNPVKTLHPVKYGNTYRLELNDALYEGVRYGWIHVRDFENPWSIDDVRLVCQIKPANYLGSFSCNDTMLSKIWYTGAYSVKLNLQKDHFGAILMERSDRHSWTGDAYPSQAASLVAFANYEFVKLNLEHNAEKNNGILSYSLYWVQSLYDYFYYTGDTATVKKYIGNASKKLDLAYDHFGKNPRQHFYGWDERLGAGFENHSLKETQNAYMMLAINSWFNFSEMMALIGEPGLASRYNNYAIEKIDLLRQRTDWYSEFGIHAAADAVNAGFTNQTEQQSLLKNEFSNRVNNISYSPFNQYSIIKAMARMHRYDEALETVRDCWGGQINYGGTTFFEVFRPSWNSVLGFNDAPPNNQCGYTSFCHPWGSGVVKWLSEEILGIKPLKPGFTDCDILPHPGRTLTQIKGSVPTPRGTIHAEIDVNKGIFNITVPAGIKARAGIPKVEKEIKSIRLNKKEIWSDGKTTSIDFQDQSGEDEDFVYLSGLSGDTYQFTIEYVGKTPEYSEKEWIYPAQFMGIDSTTCGDFGGVFGADGFVLCGHTQTSDTVVDYRKLPVYLSDITYSLNKIANWADHTADNRALAPDNESPRSIGAIYTQDPWPTLQTMTVDLATEPGRRYQVALYFLDWDDAGRRSAVEMFDLETKELIAPVQIVGNFSKGKYLIYTCNRPVRFRINQVRGPNAALSGIFFDPVLF